MYAREKEVVTDEFLMREDTYNLRRGGFGGFDHINKEGKNKNYNWDNYNGTESHYKSSKIGYELSLGANPELRHKFTKKENQLLSMKAQSTSAKQKRNLTFREIKHQQGENNSQFGKIWITNGNESKIVEKTLPIPYGWRKGRVISK
jgi:hypothetical protein